LLCIGSYCQDIEVGAGGTIARIIENSPGIEVWWIVFGCEQPSRAREARGAARLFLSGVGKSRIAILGFREGCMWSQGEQLHEAFEDLRRRFSPDLVLTSSCDGHPDHDLICSLSRTMWRGHLVLEYETGVGQPNVYVPLSESACRKKVERLTTAYSQRSEQPSFSPEVFWAQLRLRGSQCGATVIFAEAFHAHRLLFC
jgi:LmbE family N-acetylglucosaminyl deacetylase